MTDRQTRTKKAMTEASTLGVGVVLVAALLALVNYFGWKYHKRMDWTASEIYSLSEKSENVLKELAQDVDVVVYMEPTGELYGPVMELLARYEAASPRLILREVDPGRNLAEAQELVDRYRIDSDNVIVFDSAGERRFVEANDLAEYDYSGVQFGQGPRMVGFAGEQQFTSALLELTQSERPKVVFTSGHGELQLSDFSPTGLSAARELLERDNFEVESWESLGASSVPEGVELIAIVGPVGNFVQPEIDLLESFLQAGGRLLVLLDPTLSPAGGLVTTGLESLLGRYGIEVGNDIVVDPANPLPFFGADTIYVTSYGSHPITRSLAQAQLPTILSLARSVTPAESIEGYAITELVETSAEGWGESDLDNLGSIQLDEGDLAGPVSIGVALAATGDDGAAGGDASGELPDETTEAVDIDSPESDGGSEQNRGERIVVLGDATFATNAQLQNVGNLTLLSNTLNWLAEREALVAIAPKTPESIRLSLTSSEMRRIFWFVVLGLPLAVIAVGVAIHQRRKR